MRGHEKAALSGLMFFLALLCSCGGSGTISIDPDRSGLLNDSDPLAAGDVQPADRASMGFSIEPVGDALQLKLELKIGEPVGSSDFSQQGEQLVVSVVAATEQPLGELLCELHYDSSQYTPLAAQSTEVIAPLAQSLCLQLLDTPGVVSLGQVALNGQARQVEGGAVLAEVLFACEPQNEAAAKAAAQVPVHKGALSPLLWDGEAGEFRWYYVNPGDYNQDGLVGISDLSPLGRELGAAGPFAFPTAQSVIDGNTDGAISVADLTVIGQYWGNRVEGYNLYASPNITYVPATFDAISSLHPVASVSLDQTQGDPLSDRLWFSYAPAEEEEGLIFWARPYADGEEGTRSNISSTDMESPPLGPDGFNLPPEARLSLSYTGSSVPLAVTFDASASSDPDGAIIFLEWDFQGDGLFDAFSTESTVQYTYVQSGVYAPLVRVTDNGGLWDTFQAAEFEVTETEVINIPPVAVLALGEGEDFGHAPHAVHFDASGSSDPDGGIARYWWDVDGDGAYEQMTAAGEYEYTYTQSGEFQAGVRVEDGAGLSDEAQVLISVNMPPEIVLETSSTSGHPTLRVDFDASASSDSDGEIVDYEWDFNGDGVFNAGGDEADAHGHSTAKFMYSWLGAIRPKLRITDDDGGQDEESITVRLWDVTVRPIYWQSSIEVSWNNVDADEYKVYRSTIPLDPAPFHVGTVTENPAGDNSYIETLPVDDQGRWVPVRYDSSTPEDPSDDFPSIAPMVAYYYKIAPVVGGVEYPMSPEYKYGSQLPWNEWGENREWPETTAQTRSFATGLRPDLMTEAQIEWMANNFAGAIAITQSAADRIRAYNPDFVVLGLTPAASASPDFQDNYYPTPEFIYGDEIDAAGYFPYVDNHEDWFIHVDGSDIYHQRISAFPPANDYTGFYWLDVDGVNKKYLGANLLQFLGEDHFDGWILSRTQPFAYSTAQFWPGSSSREDLLDYWSPKTLNMLNYVAEKCAGHPRQPEVFAGVLDWSDYDYNVMDYSPCDGIYVDVFWYGVFPTNNGTGSFPKLMNNALAAQHDGKKLILNSPFSSDTLWRDDRNNILASYLLIRDQHTYLYYQGAFDVNRAYPRWYQECSVETGAPQDPLADTIDDYLTTDDLGTAYYRRDFEDCSAILSLHYELYFLEDYDIEYVVVHEGGLVDVDGNTDGYWEWEPWPYQQLLHSGYYHVLPQGGYVVRGLPPD